MEQKEMNMVLNKAETLIEALPYIQQFNRKIIVVKYGGSAMSNEELQKNVIKDVTLLKLVGFKPIIVHGGGKEISRWVGKVGKEAQFVGGLRVTDDETMEIAEMVNPIGATIGRKSFSSRSYNTLGLTSLILPTKPISCPSAYFLSHTSRPPSFPLMPTAFTPSSCTMLTRLLLTLLRTISAISIV